MALNGALSLAGTASETPEKNSSVAVALNEHLQYLKIRQKVERSIEKRSFNLHVTLRSRHIWMMEIVL